MSNDFTKLAEEVATKAHLGQFRNDGKTPYITHPRRVAEIAVDIVNTNRYCMRGQINFLNEIKQVAWLHDVIEDTDMFADDLRAYGFSDFVIEEIEAITKNPDKTKEDYLGYLTRVKNHGLARIVKLADLEHNMSDLKHGNMRDKYTLAIWFLTH